MVLDLIWYAYTIMHYVRGRYLARGLYASLGWVVEEELKDAEAAAFDSQQTTGEVWIMSKPL